MQVDQLCAFDPVHAPVVDPKTPGPRAGLGRHGGTHGGQHHRLGRGVHAAGQQRDALGQRRLEVALERHGRHFLVAVALLRDLADAEPGVPGVPGVDLQVLVRAARVAQPVRDQHAFHPGAAHGFAGVALAQEQDVGLHIGRGETGEGAPGQPDRAQQLGLRCHVLAHGVVAGLHRPGAGDEAHQPAGADQVQRAAEEVVVDPEPCIGLGARVGGGVVAERHVADHQVEPVLGQRYLLERRNAHVGTMRRIQRLQHPAGESVDLDGRDRAALGERSGHGAQEMADTGRGLEHAPAGEAEALHGLPHGLDHMNLGVVAVVDRGPGRRVVVGGQQRLQLLGAGAPGRIVAFQVESSGQAAPAGEAQQLAALGGVRGTKRQFDALQCACCGEVGFELGDGAVQIA